MTIDKLARFILEDSGNINPSQSQLDLVIQNLIESQTYHATSNEHGLKQRRLVEIEVEFDNVY